MTSAATLILLLGGAIILIVVFLRWLLKGPHSPPWGDHWDGEL